MIVRTRDASLELITQPDHARLAAQILDGWRADGLPARPTRATLLFATREHDRGWLTVDAMPPIDPSTGRPYDFVAAPDPIKHELWPRAVAELGAVSPYAAALVAEHALTVYAQHRDSPEWAAFFETLARERDAWLTASAQPVRQLEVDYRLLRLADLVSLAFCNGWTEPREHAGYRLILAGAEMTITPDPFDGARVPLQVPMRAIPARVYASTADLLAALRGATPSAVEGVCRGGHG